MEEQRLSFDDRIKSMGEDVQNYHSSLQEYLLSFKKVKSRLSNRCDSYRVGRDLLCKMAIGGKTLKQSGSFGKETSFQRFVVVVGL